MSGPAFDPSSSNVTIPFAERYESLVPDDTILALNTLCDPCTAFIQKSDLLQRLGRKDVKVKSKEFGKIGSPAQLRDGYKSGRCHLCALFWTRAGGYLLDPAKPFRSDIHRDAPVEVSLTARDVDKEYAMQTEGHQDWAKKLKWKVAPTPPMSVKDTILLSRISLFLTACPQFRGWLHSNAYKGSKLGSLRRPVSPSLVQ